MWRGHSITTLYCYNIHYIYIYIYIYIYQSPFIYIEREIWVFYPYLTLRQLIQPELESRFIVRPQLGPNVQSGSSPSAVLQVVTQSTHLSKDCYPQLASNPAHTVPKFGPQSSWMTPYSYPPSKDQHRNFPVPPGTEERNKSPQAEKK